MSHPNDHGSSWTSLDFIFTMVGAILIFMGLSGGGSKLKVLSIEVTTPRGKWRVVCVALGLLIWFGVGAMVYFELGG